MTFDRQTLTLNQLLRFSGIDPKEVLVFRHRPWEPALNKVFDSLVSQRRDLFDCYQSAHAPNTEAALCRAKYVASFVRFRPKLALFVGLYDNVGQRTLTVAECEARPLHQELVRLGMGGQKASDGRETLIEFSLKSTEWHRDWSERLIVQWPGLERSWYRWADRNEFPVEAISESSCLVKPMPTWDELTIDWQNLALLPPHWKAALSQWRGVYLIIDQSDGMQYVGSAYGGENLLQRWSEYSRTGHGGNKGLRSRNPANFRFAILQRTSPDLPDSDVIALEGTWKERLRSRVPYGLNVN
ncbi:MAG: GIY-YIG nuclease family protein [Novosphingobium sp.]|nr:GIY-YIG nuclease family protein [Novosphingobium sp.]